MPSPLPVLVLNGPNLNLLGEREPALYGNTTLPQIEAAAVALGEEFGLAVRCVQSNHEGVLIDLVQEARGTVRAIVINPGGLSHSSVSLLDALGAFEGPVVEVHLSQIHRREAFRQHSYISRRADAVIAGCGAQGYDLALRHVAHLLSTG